MHQGRAKQETQRTASSTHWIHLNSNYNTKILKNHEESRKNKTEPLANATRCNWWNSMQLMQLNATQFQLLKIMLWLLAQAAQSLGMVIVITCLSQDAQAKTLKQDETSWCMVHGKNAEELHGSSAFPFEIDQRCWACFCSKVWQVWPPVATSWIELTVLSNVCSSSHGFILKSLFSWILLRVLPLHG